MVELYGVKKTKEEVIKYVKNYIKNVISFKHDRYHVIISLVPQNHGRILDYGCGWGHYAIAIRDRGNSVDAIDLSENQIEICKLVWGVQNKITFSDRKIMSYKDETFDMVVSNQVIEHVHNVGNYLSEINRVLKPNGKLIVSLPNVMTPRFVLRLFKRRYEHELISLSNEIIKKYDKGNDHINAWDPHHFTTLMASAGFKLERYMPCEGLLFPRNIYMYIKMKIFKNYSYTMTFLFKKEINKKIEIND